MDYIFQSIRIALDDRLGYKVGYRPYLIMRWFLEDTNLFASA